MKAIISKNFLIFLFGSGFNGLFPILLIPVYTAYLNTEEFGLVMLYVISGAIITSLIGLSSHGAIYKKYFDLNDKDFSSFVMSCLFLVFVIFVLFFILFLAFNSLLINLFKIPDELNYFWYMVLVPSFFLYILQLKSSIYQIQKKAIAFVAVQTSRNVFLLAFVLIMYLIESISLINLLFSLALAQVISGLIALYLVFKENIKFNGVYFKNYLVDLMKFGIPMVPTSLKDHVLSFSDRFFLVSFISLSALGLYSLSFQLASIILIITTAFNNAFTPFFFELLNKRCETAKRKLISFSYLYFVAVGLVSFVIYFVSSFYILYFVDSAYLESMDYLLPAVMSFMFIGFHGIVVNYIYYTHRTVVYGFFNIFLVILNIVLNFILIEVYGAIGVAYATLISSLVMFSMTILLTNHVYPMPWFSFYKKELK